MIKTAFITGITGQDGAYLSALLCGKGYAVHGLLRPGTGEPVDHLDKSVHLHYGDLSDAGNIIRLIKEIEPDEIYNLGAQSHVGVSFEMPDYTGDIDGLGTLRVLEAIRILGLERDVRFYQASSSELFGNASDQPLNESSAFEPCSPYAAAKLYAYWIVRTYRDAYGMHASNGILFNHESPLRASEFVTRKITKSVAAIKRGEQEFLALGNLDAKRDWGHARDYVEGMWRMIQQDFAGDYVLATGETHSVRAFTEMAFAEIGVALNWSGAGDQEIGVDADGIVRVRVDPAFYRPKDVACLIGDASKARADLGWAPKTTIKELVAEMVAADLNG